MEESPEKCTRPPARTVDKNVKFHSNPIRTDLCTVVTAGPREEDKGEDIRKQFSAVNNTEFSFIITLSLFYIFDFFQPRVCYESHKSGFD